MIPVECEGGHYLKSADAEVHPGALVGPDTKIWSGAQVFNGARIGRSCVIGAGVFIERDVQLGDHSKVQRGATLYTGVLAQDHVFIGPNATFTNDRNPRSFGPWELSETVLETGASIGANATIVAGRRVGALSLVAAGAVVVKDVESGQLVMGNPARAAGWVDVGGKVISRDPDVMPPELEELLRDPRLTIENYLASQERNA